MLNESLFTPVLYGFYYGYEQPIPYRLTNTCKPYLFYDTERKIFFTDCNSIDTTYSLPLLSMEINDINNTLMYDLTNFIEDIRFSGSTAPSISSIVMLWSTLNTTYLNPKLHVVRYIDTTGDMRECTFFNDIELNKD
jgi:hypothetical protein